MRTQYDIAYGDHPRQKLDVYTPTKNPTGTVIVFWHGGGWQRGSKQMYSFVGRALSKLGFTVVLPNYRLYPEVKWPSFAEDAALAVAWVNHELTPDKLIASGHSAGGQIAAALSYDHHYLKMDAGENAVDGLIGIAGAYDFQPGPQLQPILETESRPWKATDLVSESAPPAILIQGMHDKTVLPSNASRLKSAIERHGGNAQLLLYKKRNHYTILAPFLLGWWCAPAMRRAIAVFVESL